MAKVEEKKTIVYVNIAALRELVAAFEELHLMNDASEIEFMPAITQKLAPQ